MTYRPILFGQALCIQHFSQYNDCLVFVLENILDAAHSKLARDKATGTDLLSDTYLKKDAVEINFKAQDSTGLIIKK